MSAVRDHTRPPGREPPPDFRAALDPMWAGTDPRFRVFHARLALLRVLCRGSRSRILDVSCGGGDDLLALSPLVAFGVGVDVSAPRVQRARLAALDLHLDNLRFAVGDAVAFHMDGSLPDTFDLILVRGCLGGETRALRVLRAARRRLARGGRIVVIEPHAHHPAVLWQRFCTGGRLGLPDPTGMTPGCVRRLARAEGLEPIAFELLPWVPEEEDIARLAMRGAWVRAMARFPLTAHANFAMVLRAA
ncbi:class I SAM-dependent methyltransferase [Indioceanicola profundi]|uniref:class I SAM-dependent methyltransferase n=1 Tax=Indioceanicola profundi TaxID=2220096 RepID=UPI000E6AE01E|nr:methyltransferase domain-containing protein [Indioceanicola profundi]